MRVVKRALVCEDDAPIRALVTRIVQREGFDVDAVIDGGDALAKIESDGYDLIVLDLMMPRVDGVEAVLKLGLVDYDVIVLDLMMPNLDGFAFIDTLAENAPERLKKIIVTSAASPALIQSRMEGKPVDILPKPFDIQDLLQRVRACCAAD